MSDWVYIAGETEYNQDFLVINQVTNEVIDIENSTAEMFIANSAFTEFYGPGGPGASPIATPMTIELNPQNLYVARIEVVSDQMPTSEGIYMAQIKLTTAPNITKTYIINLRVIRSLTN